MSECAIIHIPNCQIIRHGIPLIIATQSSSALRSSVRVAAVPSAEEKENRSRRNVGQVDVLRGTSRFVAPEK